MNFNYSFVDIRTEDGLIAKNCPIQEIEPTKKARSFSAIHLGFQRQFGHQDEHCFHLPM